jgi:hypothetical protein
MPASFKSPTIFNITDESGFLAIVNADKYNSFVAEDWQFEQLLNHFVDEMNKGTLIIWATAMENNWVVGVSDTPSQENVFKEFCKTIKVTNRKLYLTNYEDLTMAAQYADEQIPAKNNAGLYIRIDNGLYNVTVRQMFDANDYQDKIAVDFEIIIQPENTLRQENIKEVFWRQR